MFDVPGFNVAGLSDDELMSKLLELNRKMMWSNRFGSGDATNQINAMIVAIESERRDRMLRYIYKQRDKMFPTIIESDPEMAELNVVDQEKEKQEDATHRRKVHRDRMITKTSTPTKPEIIKTDTPGEDNG